MKVRVTMKDPDTLTDAVKDAVDELPVPDGVDKEEFDSIKETRCEKINDIICSKWMKYGEYLTVEFDTDTGTATVIEEK